MRISDWSSDVCSSDLLGWRGIPSRTQTQVCISAPFLSFVQSGPVLSVSLSERIVHGRSDARGYRKRPPQGRTGQGPVAGIGSARRHPEPQTGRPPQDHPRRPAPRCRDERSEEHTSELQSLMRISYAVFCLKKKNTTNK